MQYAPLTYLSRSQVVSMTRERPDAPPVERRACCPSVSKSRATVVCVPRVHGFYGSHGFHGSGGGPFTGSCRLIARVGDLPCSYL